MAPDWLAESEIIQRRLLALPAGGSRLFSKGPHRANLGRGSAALRLAMPVVRVALRYLPLAALLVTLGVWVVSWFATWGVTIPFASSGDEVVFEVQRGTAEFALNVYAVNFYGPYLRSYRTRSAWDGLGFFQLRYHAGLAGRPVVECDLPLAGIATLLLPWTLGAFTNFRFRLWHYLGYTALVALELAYYLRWQP